MEKEKLGSIAATLLTLAEQQDLIDQVQLKELQNAIFEDCTRCTAAEISEGFKGLDLVFMNDFNGTVRFNVKTLTKAARNASNY